MCVGMMAPCKKKNLKGDALIPCSSAIEDSEKPIKSKAPRFLRWVSFLPVISVEKSVESRSMGEGVAREC